MRYIIMAFIGAASLTFGANLLNDFITNGYDYRNNDQGAKMSGTLLLLIIGASLFLSGIVYFIKEKNKERLKEKYRMQPWMWKSDWANSKSYSNVGIRIYGLVFGLIWTAAVVPIVIGAESELKKADSEIFYWIFGIGFPAIGVLVITQSLVQWVKFFFVGKTPLNLLTLPGKQGESFEITLNRPMRNKDIEWECTILCLYNYVKKRQHGSKTEYSSVRDKLWNKKMDVELIRGRTGEVISARVILDEKMPDSGKRQKGSIDWVVDVIGKNKKGKKVFEREFAVPVYSNSQDNETINHPSQAKEVIAEQESQEIQTARSASSFSNSHVEFNENTAFTKLNDLGIFITNEGIKYTDKAWKKGFGKTFAKYALFAMAILNAVPGIILYNTSYNSAFDIITIMMMSIFQIITILLTIVFLIMKTNKYEIKFIDGSIVRENICLGHKCTQAILLDDIKDIVINVSGSSSGSSNGRTTNYMSAQIVPSKPKSVITKFKSKVWINNMGFSISPSFEDREIVSSIIELIKLKINRLNH